MGSWPCSLAPCQPWALGFHLHPTLLPSLSLRLCLAIPPCCTCPWPGCIGIVEFAHHRESLASLRGKKMMGTHWEEVGETWNQGSWKLAGRDLGRSLLWPTRTPAHQGGSWHAGQARLRCGCDDTLRHPERGRRPPPVLPAWKATPLPREP